MTSLRRKRTLNSPKLLLLPTATVLLVLGMVAGLVASNSKAASSCSLYASTSGSDGNDGSAAHPFATAQKLLTAMSPGQTGCLASGQTFNGGLNLSKGGTSSSPMTVTSTDPSNPATIFGRVVTHPGADWITFTNLNFNWDSGGQNLPSITLASDHVSLTYDDVQNGNTSICINVIDDSTWGTAHSTVIDHDRIHNCGQRPVTSYSSPGYFSHALYISGVGTTITNNDIYDTSGKGVLLRGSTNAYVANNTIDGNGSGVAFGDLSASNNEVTHNIITNSNAGCATCNTYGVFSWWGSTAVGTGNTFHDNCLYGNAGGDVSTGGGGFTATSNTIANPDYANPGAKDFSLRSGSPCAGFGAGGSPGTGGSGSSGPSPPPASPAATTTTATTTTATTTAATATTAPTTSTTTSSPAASPPPPARTPAPPPGLPQSAGAPAVTGSATVGGALSASAGTWTGAAPLSYAYQWQRCATSSGSCTQVSGATGSAYKPTADDVGQSLRVAVAASNTVGSAVAVSGPTTAVAAVYAVRQTVVDGSTVAGPVSWQASPSAGTDHVDFLVDGNVVTTEKSAPYGAPCDTCPFDTSTLSNGRHAFAVKAYASSGAVATASSTVTVANVPPPATASPPVITGTLRVGSTLNSTAGTWSGAGPLTYSYNWLRCNRRAGGCSQIDGASSASYTLTSADRNMRLRVMVSAQNAQASAAATSDATAPVKG